MAYRIPDTVIAEIRARTDIVAVVGEYVRLKRSGANYVGLCPFHEERTPSFYVSPARNAFYCFGCQEKGDVIDFLRKMEGKSFVEVIRDLAARLGVSLPEHQVPEAEQGRRKSSSGAFRERLLAANEVAAHFFEAVLWSDRGEAARSYLAERGIREETIRAFRLGYAPDGWDGLVQHLGSRGVSGKVALEAGLVVARKGAQGSEHAEVRREWAYDFFRNRVMFPIRDMGGKILGFSGRILPGSEDPRKYVNSPDTPVFKKSEAVFGLHQARRALRRTSEAIVVEGNLDVLAMHQAGFAQTVAPLGTAFTRQQALRVAKLASRIVLLFDGDEAGRKASARSAEMLLELGLDGRVAELPEGLDPAEALQEGQALVGRSLEAAEVAAEYLVGKIARQAGPAAPERARAVERAAAILRMVRNPVERALYLERTAGLLGVEPRFVQAAIARQPARSAEPTGSRPPSGVAGLDPVARHALWLLALVVARPHLAASPLVARAVDFVEAAPLRRALELARERQAETGHVEAMEVLETLGPDWEASGVEVIFSDRFEGDFDAHRALEETVRALELASLEERIRALNERIRKARALGERELLRDLSLERHELSHRVDELRRGRA